MAWKQLKELLLYNMLLEFVPNKSKPQLKISADKHPAFQVHTSEDGRTLVLYGYLYNLHSLKWLSPADFNPVGNITSFLQNHVGGTGSVCVVHPDGRTDIYTDFFRLYVLYLYKSEKTLLISNTLEEIRAQAAVSINATALLELSLINCTLGTKTLFKEVTNLDEGCVYSIRYAGGNWTCQQDVYDGFPTPTGAAISLTDFTEIFNQHVSKGLALSHSVSLAITAGLDSRVTLSALLGEKEKIHTYTHGFVNSQDVLLAQKIAAACGVTHRFYNLNSPDFWEQIPNHFAQVNQHYEGQLNALSHAHALVSYPAQQQHAATFFSSFGGELLRSYYLPATCHPNSSMDELAAGILKISMVKTHFPIFKRPAADILDELRQSIYNELAGAPAEGDAVYLADYYYHRRNFNSVTTRFAGAYFQIFNPYFSRDIYQAVVDQPAELKRSGALQKSIVYQNSPILAKYLINQKEPMQDTLEGKWQAGVQRAAYYAKVLWNKWRNQPAYLLHFTDYDTWIKQHHRDWFLEQFEQAEHAGIFDTMALKQFAADYLEGRAAYAYYKLLTNIHSTVSVLQAPMSESA